MKNKIKLRLYEDKIKNMSKDELIKELKSASERNDFHLFISGLTSSVGITCIFTIPYFETTGSQIAMLVGIIGSLIIAGTSSCAYIDDKNQKENKLEILYQYVDKDEDKKEKDNTKTLNS